MSSLLPSNASTLELALEAVMKSDMDSPIRDLWNPFKCPVELLWVLAITFQVDEWDDVWSEATKRIMLVEAYRVHCIKGTPESIRRILRNAGYDEIEIKEGLGNLTYDGAGEYNGHNYYGWDDAWPMYRIYLKRAISLAQAKQVKRIINATAPLHCILMGVHFINAKFLYDGNITYDGSYSFGET